MKKYIIPEIMVIVADEAIMKGLHQSEGSGIQLNNNGFFDDLDDGMDINFKTKRLWDDENEAR